jgi:cbb3-type cytochrome oxidase subunit 3
VSNLKRHIGQKVAFAASVFCAVLSLPVLGIFVWLLNEKGMNDTWTPSALTTVFFLLFCAVVLYVVSRPQPPLPPPDAAH